MEDAEWRKYLAVEDRRIYIKTLIEVIFLDNLGL